MTLEVHIGLTDSGDGVRLTHGALDATSADVADATFILLPGQSYLGWTYEELREQVSDGPVQLEVRDAEDS